MGVDDVGVVEPTAAERVCSVVVAAGSLMVATGGRRWELTGAHALHGGGRLLLRVPAGCGLATAVARAPRGHRTAVLEFTDVAPAAVRSRVRARVTVTGWLAPAGRQPEATGTCLRLDPSHILLDTTAGPVPVGLDELTLAQPDLLATHEAGMLTHLADRHRDMVALLTRLVDSRLLHGVTDVWPLALDRYGITLRLEHARSHRDVRLPFTAPLREAAQAGAEIQALIAAAHVCPCHRRPLTRP
ncbi:MAG: hypothetical protein JWN52_6591 [Actinomycetia bacterium]|nr:hypothetical protein [Actinomycetes bacterium]